MNTSSETQKLIEATERNTHAVRSLATFFVSFFWLKLIGVVLFGLGVVWEAQSNSAQSWVPILVGAGLLFFSAIASVAGAQYELNASRKPSNPKT
jgi:hypothetical protein